MHVFQYFNRAKIMLFLSHHSFAYPQIPSRLSSFSLIFNKPIAIKSDLEKKELNK